MSRDNYEVEPSTVVLDQAIQGQFDAYHAEKKMAAWWAIQALEKHFGTRDVTELRKLRQGIVDGDRYATIFVSNERICPGCADFIYKLEVRTGLVFTVTPMTQVGPHRTIRQVEYTLDGTPRPEIPAGEVFVQ